MLIKHFLKYGGFTMKKKVIATLSAIIFGLSLVFTGCGNQSSSSQSSGGDSDGELETIRLGVMTSNISHQTALIGLEKGYYEKHGLNVEITEYSAGINTVDALVTGQLDVGYVADYAGINRIGNTSTESNLRFFSQLANSSMMKFYVNPDKIKTIADLKGKSIITLLGTAWDYWNAKTIQYAGLTDDDVELKAVDSAQNGLAIANSGEADAFWASGENASRLQEYGWEPLLTEEDLGVCTYEIYMSSSEYLSQNQETIQKFLEATQEIIDYIQNNVDDAADIIYEKTGLEQSVFKNNLAGYTMELDFDQNVYDDLNDINTWAYGNGNYENEFNLTDFIDTDALEAVYPDKVNWSAE